MLGNSILKLPNRLVQADNYLMRNSLVKMLPACATRISRQLYLHVR